MLWIFDYHLLVLTSRHCFYNDQLLIIQELIILFTELWSLFTPYSCLPAGSIYVLVINSPERKASVGRLLLPLSCILSHYPSWRLGKLRLQWLVRMCGFQYGTTPKYLYLPYAPLKGGSSRPILLLERHIKYTSGSSRICTLSRVERF